MPRCLKNEKSQLARDRRMDRPCNEYNNNFLIFLLGWLRILCIFIHNTYTVLRCFEKKYLWWFILGKASDWALDVAVVIFDGFGCFFPKKPSWFDQDVGGLGGQPGWFGYRICEQWSKSVWIFPYIGWLIRILIIVYCINAYIIQFGGTVPYIPQPTRVLMRWTRMTVRSKKTSPDRGWGDLIHNYTCKLKQRHPVQTKQKRRTTATPHCLFFQESYLCACHLSYTISSLFAFDLEIRCPSLLRFFFDLFRLKEEDRS